jgi:hypothetical protein
MGSSDAPAPTMKPVAFSSRGAPRWWLASPAEWVRPMPMAREAGHGAESGVCGQDAMAWRRAPHRAGSARSWVTW